MTPLRIQSFLVPKIITSAFVVVLSILALLYILFQARLLISGPQIVLTDVPGNVQHERLITLSGTASNITAIQLNGRPIVTDEQGAFFEHIILENGYTIVRITAQDRYGREAAITESFVYSPSSSLFNS